ncbi:rhomboid family intramembrane serine protease [Streptomyces sp. NBC_01443]|uniref:rhomboid family intramembrane serine protease n=1 Tax=Streptomyces sp. NBC_01443 TaxID=2903868 RepID=UPI00224EC1A9|nr:rhomboid family intramembrane serine protease [Streptomyces sp. NBC_01443]MCX4628297.1 rhomboid family intramembrane serine protease [Streptomyces sp. NBC_01443]
MAEMRLEEWSQAERAKAAGKLMLGWVALLWLIEVVDLATGHALDAYGIIPRTADGLTGIPLSPFLHFGFDHVASNSVPLLVLGFVAALSGIRRFLVLCAVVVLVDGLGVWLVSASNTITAGASGLVFGLFGYLLVRGFVERRALGVLVGVAIAAYWGTGILTGILPTNTTVSWQGHLFGLLTGVTAAFLFGRRTARG